MPDINQIWPLHNIGHMFLHTFIWLQIFFNWSKCTSESFSNDLRQTKRTPNILTIYVYPAVPNVVCSIRTVAILCPQPNTIVHGQTQHNTTAPSGRTCRQHPTTTKHRRGLKAFVLKTRKTTVAAARSHNRCCTAKPVSQATSRFDCIYTYKAFRTKNAEHWLNTEGPCRVSFRYSRRNNI